MRRPPSRLARARTPLAIVGAVALLAAVAFVATRSETGGDDSGAEERIPQLEDAAFVVYGDSWSTHGYWNTKGHQWSDLLSSSVASMTNRGVGNTTMEDAANLMSGTGPARWVASRNTCVLVMSVLNTARLPSDAIEGRAASEASLKAAATSIAGMVLSDHYAEDRTDLTTYVGAGWGAVPNTHMVGGTIQGSVAPGGVKFVVPEGYSDRQLWMATLSGPQASSFRLSRNDIELAFVATPISDPTSLGYTRYLLPIGRVSTGDRITVESFEGGFWYDGMYLDNGANHVVFATEPSHLPTTIPSAFNNEAQSDAHNDALREVVDEVNRMVPQGASLVDLDAADGWDNTTMTAVDEVHPNDKGQRWVYGQMLVQLRDNVPQTTRLRSS